MSKSLNLFGGTAVGLVVMMVGAYNFADRNIANMPGSPGQLGELSAIARAALNDAAAQAAAPGAAPVAETAGAEGSPAGAAPFVAVTEPVPAPAEGGLIAAAHADEGTGAGKRFGLGRAALPEELAAWDVDVRPDGTGLPVGSGSVADGEMLFSENCAVCHGEFAEGVGNWPELAGGDGTLADDDPVKTVGSYWPYLSTAWDYVHRSMPFGNAQSLTADETYAITAYILYSNFLVDDDFVLSNENFLEVEMPNADGFIIDDRAETEYPQWRAEACMENCKPAPVEITMRATVLDVTPDDPTDDAPIAEEAAATPEAAPAETQAAQATEPAPAETVAVASAALDPALVGEGEKVFKKCSACHQIGEGAKNRTGPHLNAILDRDIGSVDGFKYSSTMAEMPGIWDSETLHAFLADPRGVVKGTKMAFAGLKKQEEIDAVIAYMQSVSP